MNFKKFISAEDNAKYEIRFLRLAVAGLTILAIAEAGVTLKLAGSEKTIIVPPEINRTFWVSGKKVSADYLEEMAYWYSGLALNVNAATSDYQQTLFLKFAAPSEYGRLQGETKARGDYIKKNSVATQFTVSGMTSDPEALKSALTGTLTTFVADRKISERRVVYMVGFKYMNGRLYVSDFKETSEQTPFIPLVTTGN